MLPATGVQFGQYCSLCLFVALYFCFYSYYFLAVPFLIRLLYRSFWVPARMSVGCVYACIGFPVFACHSVRSYVIKIVEGLALQQACCPQHLSKILQHISALICY